MSGRNSGQAAEEIERIAADTGFSIEAVEAMATAMRAGGGTMAQFNHSELGGFGQWSSGGMLMIGDMFNGQLKSRVSDLAERVSDALRKGRIVSEHSNGGGGERGQWWPGNLGSPSSTGSQNGMRYAVFPHSARLAIEENGRVSLYETGDHHIGGVSQQQGGGSTLSFTSQSGTVSLASLRRIDDAATQGQGGSDTKEKTPSGPQGAEDGRQPQHDNRGPSAKRAEVATDGTHDPIDTIRRLAELHQSGHLTDEEYRAKKSELLGRI